MTEKKIKKSIMPCVIAAVIACLLFAVSGSLFIRASADEEPGVVIVDEESQSTEQSETESQAPTSTSTTRSSERTSWTNKYRTTTSTTSASSSSAPSDSKTSAAGTTADRTSRRPYETTKPITGVPNDFNRTTYRGGSTASPIVETFTTAPQDTTAADTETATVSEPDETDFYMGESDYTETSDESSSSALTPEEIAAKEHRAALMRKIAIALGAAAIVLILGGFGFVLWYKKENELKEEQKNLVRFEEDNKEE